MSSDATLVEDEEEIGPDPVGHSAHVCSQSIERLLGQGTVRVVEQLYILNTELGRRVGQFSRSDPPSSAISAPRVDVSPCVKQSKAVDEPAAAKAASVAPRPKLSSSGWAHTARTEIAPGSSCSCGRLRFPSMAILDCELGTRVRSDHLLQPIPQGVYSCVNSPTDKSKGRFLSDGCMRTGQVEPSDTATQILDVAERLVQVRCFNGFSYADVAVELNIT